MVEHNAKLTSAEISGLWQTYQQLTMSKCFLTNFLQHIKDQDIRKLLEKSMKGNQTLLKVIEGIFNKEGIPLPDGFTDKDVNLDAPPLFNDPFALGFIYYSSQMSMINYSFITSNIARQDIITLFTDALKGSADFYQTSIGLMQAKGIYDRPPIVPYPDSVEYIQKKSYITDFLDGKRPLNVMELTEIFFNVERNYYSVLLCTAFAQVVEDEEIKEFIKEGKKISEDQIDYFNEVLKKEDLLGIVPVGMEVTDSTVSPFSEKFVMALFTFLNSIDITLIGHGLSMYMRSDLAGHAAKYLTEVLAYMGKGFNIMVNRRWIEQPPSATDRKKLSRK